MNIGRFVAVLTTVCAVSGFGLSFFYALTQPLIEANRTARELRLKQAMIPAATTFRLRAASTTYRAVEDALDSSGAIVGVLVRDACRGYGGEIEYIAAFNTSSASLLGVRVLSHRETPGLGAKVVAPEFLERFVGKTGDELRLARDGSGGTVDALSGATITSRALAQALARASADPQLVVRLAPPMSAEQEVSTAPARRAAPRRRPDPAVSASTDPAASMLSPSAPARGDSTPAVSATVPASTQQPPAVRMSSPTGAAADAPQPARPSAPSGSGATQPAPMHGEEPLP